MNTAKEHLFVRDMPTLVSAAVVSAATNTAISIITQVSTVYIPSIVPPSGKHNPFIYRPGNMPDGTVFIAVGAIVGAILLGIFIWWLISTIVSYKRTKEANQLMANYYPTGNDNNIEKLTQRRIISDSSILSSGSSSWGNAPTSDNLEEKYLQNSNNYRQQDHNDDNVPLDNPFQSQQPFNAIQGDFNSGNYRNSLFISPTLHMVQQQQQQQQQQSNETSIYSTPTKYKDSTDQGFERPERTASPERKSRARSKHRRNQSSIGLLSHSPTKLQPDEDCWTASPSPEREYTTTTTTSSNPFNSPTRKGHDRRKSASVFLENMLQESL